MAKILITGSSSGLGAMAARELIGRGREVTLHARDDKKKAVALAANPQAHHVIIGDLAKPEEVLSLAQQANEISTFDVIIHNAGVYTGDSQVTAQVNLLAPYVLTALLKKSKRIIYVSSSMHRGARLDIENLDKKLDYSGSKLALLLLVAYISRIWPDVHTNALDPGWVPTRMGGKGAPDDLVAGYMTQVWLSESNDEQALQSGNYYYHQKLSRMDDRAQDQGLQEALIAKLADLTGVGLDK